MKNEALFLLKRLLQFLPAKNLWQIHEVIPHVYLLLTGYVRSWFCVTELEQC